jgi:hypothetical protein
VTKAYGVPTMRSIFDANGPKRPVSLSLNEDLIAWARDVTNNLAELVESLLAEYVALERASGRACRGHRGSGGDME